MNLFLHIVQICGGMLAGQFLTFFSTLVLLLQICILIQLNSLLLSPFQSSIFSTAKPHLVLPWVPVAALPALLLPLLPLNLLLCPLQLPHPQPQ